MPGFPFSAIVGQDTLKRALLLSVIQPSLGGVLIRGTKGVAKSTAVRALASLLPPLETVAGCPFQRCPSEDIPDWPLPADVSTITRSVPLIELPLGATEDRVLGALHLEKALRGERAFEPGLLAAANRGLLYIDEVNLLPDHLVDILLDAAASGVHRLEREGLSLRHPARFVLIGTMNPEEGDLRPQLLDRFGLVVDVADLADPADRAEAVRRRLTYEADPVAFESTWKPAEAAEAERVVQAQRLLPSVYLGDTILRVVSERCVAAGVEGLRADLTVCKAACAWAAYQGRTDVEPGDVDAVAELALAHRRTKPPPPPRGEDRGSSIEDRGSKEPDGQSVQSTPRSAMLDRQTFESAGLFAPRPQPNAKALAGSTVQGRWRQGAMPRRGPAQGWVRVYKMGDALAWVDTIRAAAQHQGICQLQMEDLRGRPRRGPAGCLLLFVVDASGSMAAWQRMRQTKAAILALLVQAYQRRDQVALLAFHGQQAELVLPPARGLRTARQALEELPVGGTTPLAHGLQAACRLVRRQQRWQPRQPIWTVLLTDGRTNVGLSQSATDNGQWTICNSPESQRDAWQDALSQAKALAACGTECLVVDTETGWPRFGRAAALTRAMGATCLAIEEVLGRPLCDPWRRAV